MDPSGAATSEASEPSMVDPNLVAQELHSAYAPILDRHGSIMMGVLCFRYFSREENFKNFTAQLSPSTAKHVWDRLGPGKSKAPIGYTTGIRYLRNSPVGSHKVPNCTAPAERRSALRCRG